MKKLKREQRREVAKHFDLLDAAYFIQNYIRPKPKYFPTFIWNRLVSIILKPKNEINEHQ